MSNNFFHLWFPSTFFSFLKKKNDKIDAFYHMGHFVFNVSMISSKSELLINLCIIYVILEFDVKMLRYNICNIRL